MHVEMVPPGHDINELLREVQPPADPVHQQGDAPVQGLAGPRGAVQHAGQAVPQLRAQVPARQQK